LLATVDIESVSPEADTSKTLCHSRHQQQQGGSLQCAAQQQQPQAIGTAHAGAAAAVQQ
jgi:hypothetical protein